MLEPSSLKAQTGKPSPVADELNRTETITGAIEDNLSTLLSRLDPVLSQSSNAGGNEKVPRPERHGLAGRISSSNDRLAKIVDFLQDIHEKLEI